MAKYWEIAYQHLKKYGKITNIEIMDMTNTTCPHSVIRDIKKHGAAFRTEDGVSKDGKKFRTYYLIKPILSEQFQAITEKKEEEKQELTQLSLGLAVEKMKLSALEMRRKYNV